ncbi:hypothetical protein HK105_204045 [Polyrhizophydium stewartii]|uniref:Prolyl endopeptidase n=1 Tax=Polyrhizophydium stewartii TaxID=2732419 RepID=A0ABR4NA00_9FUNG
MAMRERPPGVVAVAATLAARDFDRKAKRPLRIAVVVDAAAAAPRVLARSLPADAGDAGIAATSPSGRRLLSSRVVDKKRIEITTHGSLTTVDVTKKHGDFFADGTFGGVGWSSDETKLVYVADREAPEDDSKYVQVTDLGEGFTGKIKPTLVFVDLADPANPKVTPLPLDLIASQAILTPAGDRIIFSGFSDSPLPFGIRFCYNRRTAIYSVATDGTGLTRLSGDGVNGRYPRLTPDATSVVYLSNKVGGAHGSCSELVRFDLASQTNLVVVPVVRSVTSKTDFPGLFSDRLHANPWVRTPDGLFAIMQTSWRCQETLVAVDMASGRVTNITALLPESDYSYALLDVRSDGWIVAARSTLNKPQSLVLGRFVGVGSSVAWTVIHEPEIPMDVAEALSNIDFRVAGVPGRHENVEVLLMTPKTARHPQLQGIEGGAPLIVLPHGGPHGVITTLFSLYCALLTSLGFAVANVNYTGSTGYGEEFVQALVGRIGELDLADVNAAAYWAAQEPGINKDKVSLFGGSHGGFITAHLLGFQPDFYKAGVLRNPVINVGAMVATTDISDWCFAEAGLPFSQAAPHLLTPKEYEHMFVHSPASVAHKVVAPVLLMLGAGDRRVPPSEGLRWSQYLRGAGRDVRVLMFPETGHGLDTFEAERVGFDAICDFLLKHFGKPASA